MLKDLPTIGSMHVELSENTVEQVTQGMFGVVNEPGGTGNSVKLQGIEFCGKSGTAQMMSYEIPMAICVLVPVIVAGVPMNPTGSDASGGFAAAKDACMVHVESGHVGPGAAALVFMLDAHGAGRAR